MLELCVLVLYKKKACLRSQPNGKDFQKCVESRAISRGPGSHFLSNDIACSRTLCSICQMPQTQTYYLRGNIPKEFEHKFSLSMNLQSSNTVIIFEGQQGIAQLVWDPLMKRTDLVNHHLNVTISYNQHPFGLLEPKNRNEFANVSRLMFTNVNIFKKKSL